MIGRRRYEAFGVALAAGAAYIALDWLTYIRPLQHSSITPWNPQPAVAIALLALAGQRWLPAVLVAVLVSEVLVRDAAGGLVTTLLVSTVLTLGYAAMAAALSGRVSVRNGLGTGSEMTHLIAVVTLGALATGSLYVGALWAGGAPLPGPYFEALAQFWIGDCVGILVFLPALLMLADPRKREELRELARRPAAWLQAMSIALALWIVFGPAFAQPFKIFYVLFLPLVWIAVQSGLLGAVLATLAIQIGVIIATQTGDYPNLTVFELQALLIALTVTGLILGVIVDERRRSAEELRESLRLAAAGEMSAALAHELNQPLTALTSYARAAALMAEEENPDTAKIRATLAKVLQEAGRSAEVVRRLRDFFRTGATTLEPASLDDLAQGVVEAMGEKARALGVSLERRSEGDAPAVLVDTLQIELVLKNLVANGLDAAAMDRGARSGWVRIEVAPDTPGYARAMVRDSGPGVAPHDRDRVFEPFWSSRASGMGMGLAISRAIVEAHGGRLWVETHGEGAFGFTVPAVHG